MGKSDRFASLAELHAEKERVTSLRDGHAARLEGLYTTLRSSVFRKRLATEALGDAMNGMLSRSVLGTMIGRGGVAGGLSLAMRSGSGGWMRRAGLFALGLVAPALIDRLQHVPFAKIGSEVRVSLDRLRNHLDQRRAARAQDLRN